VVLLIIATNIYCVAISDYNERGVVFYVLGKRLVILRNKRGLTQEQIAVILKMSRSTYAQYEVDRRKPDYDTLKMFADYFGVSTDYLLGLTDNPAQYDKSNQEAKRAFREVEIIPYGPTVRVPVLGTIAAGFPLYAEQNIIEYVDVQANEVKGGEFFYLIVKGDSMTGSRIHPGDKVLVRRQEEVENGEIAVVMVGKEEATLKRVKFLEEAAILYPDNPKYQPQIYKIEEIKILGKIVKVEFKP